MNAELSQLISLQDVDVEIKRLKAEIEAQPERQAQLERNFAESSQDYFELRTQLETTRAEHAALEASLTAEQQKHQKFKDDLNKMTSPNIKVYETVMREIDISRKAISAQETELLKLMERIERLEAQVNERQPVVDARRVEIDQQLSNWETTVTVHRERLAQLSLERGPMLATLSPPVRATYERLSRMRSGLALAEARNYSCTACRISIRPHVYNQIRQAKEIITCENCGRILYFRAEAATV